MENWFDVMEKGGVENITCKDTQCIYAHEGKRIAMPMNNNNIADLCNKVDLIVAPSVTDVCPDKVLLPQLAETGGAYVMYVNTGGIRIAHSALNENRPWPSFGRNDTAHQ
jgi:hypothetical protein